MIKDNNLEAIEVSDEGYVAAGRMVAFPAPESSTTLALSKPMAHLAKQGLLKTMTISGNSLEDIGIYDGDKVIVKRAFSKKEVGPHTICIVYIPATGEIVAKRVSFNQSHILLRSCNRDVPDMYVEPNEVDIRGVVIGLHRSPDALGRFDRGYDEDIPL